MHETGTEVDAARWARSLPWLLVFLLAFGIRVAVVTAQPLCNEDAQPSGCQDLSIDAEYFHGQGAALADGHLFIDPFAERVRPSAGDPPAFATLLAAFTVVGLDSVEDQRLALAGVGALGAIALGALATARGTPSRPPRRVARGTQPCAVDQRRRRDVRRPLRARGHAPPARVVGAPSPAHAHTHLVLGLALGVAALTARGGPALPGVRGRSDVPSGHHDPASPADGTRRCRQPW